MSKYTPAPGPYFWRDGYILDTNGQRIAKMLPEKITTVAAMDERIDTSNLLRASWDLLEALGRITASAEYMRERGLAVPTGIAEARAAIRKAEGVQP